MAFLNRSYQISGTGDFSRATFYVNDIGDKEGIMYSTLRQVLLGGGYPIREVQRKNERVSLLGEARTFLSIRTKKEYGQVFVSKYGKDLYIMLLVLPERGFNIGAMKVFADLKENLNPFELQDLEMFSYAIQKAIIQSIETVKKLAKLTSDEPKYHKIDPDALDDLIDSGVTPDEAVEMEKSYFEIFDDIFSDIEYNCEYMKWVDFLKQQKSFDDPMQTLFKQDHSAKSPIVELNYEKFKAKIKEITINTKKINPFYDSLLKRVWIKSFVQKKIYYYDISTGG
jgi:hypothetical protein